jgi:adenylyl-sulfate kinase
MLESLAQSPSLVQPVLSYSGAVVWLTGLSGAGKSTIAQGVYEHLVQQGRRCELLDGDQLRQQLCRDLGFSHADREENVRRIGYVAGLLSRHDVIVLVAVIAPYNQDRQLLREQIPNFIEVFVDAPLATCESRDPKGLYRRARSGQIKGFTGIDDPYEAPLAPECHLKTSEESSQKSIDTLAELLMKRLARAKL